ncbi:hypothetical protein K432DRAFT_349016 [Lepidopterella palustris CBS 459.81]|uniref:YTH domain-containing protein n=1 Tax=Lepidopterella palustris CBS 459.81 TaxID=1314670 RepID=A0A8E2JH77_9PEZI|nr:hypothetical protein K432DRAFT_349016 [Lepidopterella palustris CBS 459.81]
MDNIPSEQGSQPQESSRAGFPQDDIRTSNTTAHGSSVNLSPSDSRSPSNNAPFYSQFSSLPQPQPHLGILRAPTQQSNASYGISPGQDHPLPQFNMGAMAGALPEYSSTAQGHGNPQAHHLGQRSLSVGLASAVVYQQPQISQSPGNSSTMYPGQLPYSPGFGQGQYPPTYINTQGAHHSAYQQYNPNQQRSAGLSPLQPSYPNFQQHPSQFVYYPSSYGAQGQFAPSFPAQTPQQGASYNRRASLPSFQMPLVAQNVDPTIPSGSYPSANRHIPSGFSGDHGVTNVLQASETPQGISRPGSETSASSILRGPPRKPKQSGHALWVGNLPLGTTVADLKDHFSRDATKDIESLFFISKSNCAFVNYRTEASCDAAMHRFHDSRFHGVRLVCRLRRSSAPASGVPTGPSAMSGPRASSVSPRRSPQPTVDGEDIPKETEEAGEEAGEEALGGENAKAARVAEKFFIVKSLTLQDLELSVKNGLWATQSHNEETLNKAYESAENVYLIFSANKSGEYFGYARMASSIHEDATQIMGTVLPEQTDTLDTAAAPRSIPTPATEFAPKGRIIDDSARGTIFWEADLSDVEEDGVIGKEQDDKQNPNTAAIGDGGGEENAATTAQTWGRPFKVEWMSTNRLPFYRTRGLRNPWNANREVKIARDGTELEPSVGKKLVQMFHRLGPSVGAQGQLRPH